MSKSKEKTAVGKEAGEPLLEKSPNSAISSTDEPRSKLYPLEVKRNKSKLFNVSVTFTIR